MNLGGEARCDNGTSQERPADGLYGYLTRQPSVGCAAARERPGGNVIGGVIGDRSTSDPHPLP